MHNQNIFQFHQLRALLNTLFFVFLNLSIAACGLGSSGNDPIDNSIQFQQLPLAAPLDVNFIEHNETLYASWSSVKGAKNYKVYLSSEKNIDISNKNSEHITVHDSLVSTQLVINNLELNKPYYLVLSAVDEVGNESSSPEYRIALTTGQIVLELKAPQNFNAKAEEGKIRLAWDDTPEAINYIIYYSQIDSNVDPVRAKQIIEIATPVFTHKNLISGEDFYYRVSAVTPAGVTPLSDVQSAQVLPYSSIPKVPTGFTAKAGDGLVALSWEPVKNAQSYKMYMAQEAGVNAGNVNQLQGGKTFSNIINVSTNRVELKNDSTYYFSLSAENDAGESESSIAIAVTPKAVNPNVPQNVSARSTLNANIIAWNAVEGASKYTVYWSNEIEFDSESIHKIEDITLTEFVHSNLNTGELRYYYVTAHDESGESQTSALVSAAPIVLPPAPNPPSQLKANISLEEINLSWEIIPGAEEYVLYMASEAGINKANYFQLSHGVRLSYISDNAFTFSNLLPDTDYYATIASANPSGEGDLSSEIHFKTPANSSNILPEENTPITIPPVPQAPAALDVISTTLDQISLEWSASKYAQAYTVYVGIDDSVGPDNNFYVEDFTAQIGSISNLPFGADLYFAVTARNNTGESNISPIVISRPIAPILTAPENLGASPGFQHVNLSWNPVDNAVSYILRWSLSPDAAASSDQFIEVQDTSALHESLSDGDVIYYVVSSKNIDDRESTPSAEVSVKVGQRISDIELKDPLLRACINSEEKIYAYEITDLNCFVVEGYVSDLSGLEFLTSLMTLKLPVTSAANLSPLSHLTSNLVNLTLMGSLSADVSPIAGLEKLEFLSIVDTPLTSTQLILLATNKSVIELVLNNNNISDISPLLALSQLVNLNLESNAVSNLAEPINWTAIEQLKTLNLANNAIVDINSLSGLIALENLDLSGNSIGNISPLGTMANLKLLDISHNAIHSGVKYLLDLQQLTAVNLQENVSLSCVDIKSLDANIDLSDGFDLGNVIWSNCGLLMDQQSVSLAAGPSGCLAFNGEITSTHQSFIPSMEVLGRVDLSLRTIGIIPQSGMQHSINIREDNPSGNIIGEGFAFISGGKQGDLSVSYNFIPEILLDDLKKTYVIEFPFANENGIVPLDWNLNSSNSYANGFAEHCQDAQLAEALDFVFNTYSSPVMYINIDTGIPQDSLVYRYNPIGQELTLMGSSNTPSLSDIALLNGQLFTTNFFSGLFVVNTLNEAPAKIGDIGFSSVTALTSFDNALYAAAIGDTSLGGSLLRIDPVTGEGTNIGNFGTSIWAAGDLAFLDDGRLFASVIVDGEQNFQLAEINKDTGEATLIGDTGFQNIYGLGNMISVESTNISPEIVNTLYALNSAGSLIILDLETGQGKEIIKFDPAVSGVYGGMTSLARSIPILLKQ